MVNAGTDGSECASGRRTFTVRTILAIAPTSYSAVCPHPTSMFITGADGLERAFRWGGLAPMVAAPANHGTIRPHSAIVLVACADRLEIAAWRECLTVFIIAPAGKGSVRSQGAGMTLADADGLEGPLR